MVIDYIVLSTRHAPPLPEGTTEKVRYGTPFNVFLVESSLNGEYKTVRDVFHVPDPVAIGPWPKPIRLSGDSIEYKRIIKHLGRGLVQSNPLNSEDDARSYMLSFVEKPSEED